MWHSTPIDGDHPYRIYSIKFQISLEDLVIHVNNAISKFQLADSEIKKDELIVPHISSYTINLDYGAVTTLNPDLKQDLFEVERLQMRFKFDPKRSQLRIMALALALTNSDVTTNCNLIKYRECGMRFDRKMCETFRIPDHTKDSLPQKICPLCIDRSISNFIISHCESELLKNLELNGVKIEKMEL